MFTTHHHQYSCRCIVSFFAVVVGSQQTSFSSTPERPRTRDHRPQPPARMSGARSPVGRWLRRILPVPNRGRFPSPERSPETPGRLLPFHCSCCRHGSALCLVRRPGATALWSFLCSREQPTVAPFGVAAVVRVIELGRWPRGRFRGGDRSGICLLAPDR